MGILGRNGQTSSTLGMTFQVVCLCLPLLPLLLIALLLHLLAVLHFLRVLILVPTLSIVVVLTQTQALVVVLLILPLLVCPGNVLVRVLTSTRSPRLVIPVRLIVAMLLQPLQVMQVFVVQSRMLPRKRKSR